MLQAYVTRHQILTRVLWVQTEHKQNAFSASNVSFSGLLHNSLVAEFDQDPGSDRRNFTQSFKNPNKQKSQQPKEPSKPKPTHQQKQRSVIVK